MILEAINASKLFKSPNGEEIKILDEINVSFESRSTTALIGASGSGKTTLLGILSGLDFPSSGTIRFQNKNLYELKDNERTHLRANEMGFIFQNFQLIPNLNALQNVMLPLELVGNLTNHEMEIQSRHELGRVGLENRSTHYPHQLSGGEQQRVAIARAIVHKPKVLFADEPTGNLDTITGENISDLLFETNQELGTTLILVTHSIELAKRAKVNLQITGGRIVSS